MFKHITSRKPYNENATILGLQYLGYLLGFLKLWRPFIPWESKVYAYLFLCVFQVSAAVLEAYFQREMIPHELWQVLSHSRHVFCCFQLRSVSIQP